MKISFYRTVMLVGFVLWVAETAYFGFNPKAESNIEGFLDTLSWALILGGWIGDVLRGLQIIKIEKTELPKAEKMELTGPVTINNSPSEGR